jgi:alginate O-acetyltransferase complex protein AlgI
MLFSSAAFFPFLAAALLLYWGATALAPRNARRIVQHVVLVAASLWFYMSWNPRLVGLILLTIVFDWAAALVVDRTASERGRRALVVGSVAVNLGVLVLFKYANFFLDQVETAASLFGQESDLAVSLVLPVGVSFYTFESMSYVIDVHRRLVRPIRNPLDYAVFITFFPHLVAGPIVRIREFAPQLARALTPRDVHVRRGLYLLLLGLVKKVLISDQVAPTADAVFANPAAFGCAGTWTGVVAYTIQIYCDFSGYSDMALGLACLFGYRLPENFDMPYLSRNLTEFWRRWHITLSRWLRDYLYIPLGGSRGTRAGTWRNLAVVMLLGGLWHGASWTFVVWGGIHGMGLVVHREWIRLRAGRASSPPVRAAGALASWAVTLAFVMIAWVFFRAQDLTDAAAILASLAGFGRAAGSAEPPLAVAAAVLLLVIGHAWGAWRPVPAESAGERRHLGLVEALACSVAIVALLVFAPDGTRPFIYFQF